MDSTITNSGSEQGYSRQTGAPDILADPTGNPSPFEDPHYGEEAEQPNYVIASHPTWSLEQNQSSLTGYAGLAWLMLSAAITGICIGAPQLPQSILDRLPFVLQTAVTGATQTVWEWRHQLQLIALFLAMFLVETLVFKVHRRHFDFSRPRMLDDRAWRRIAWRWVALAFCLGLANFLYDVLGEYNFHLVHYPETYYYSRYRRFFHMVVWLVGIGSVPYFWLVERYARFNGPADEFLILGRCLQRLAHGAFVPATRAQDWRAWKNHHAHNLFRGLFVKFFFVPLMLTWCLDSWGFWERGVHYLVYEQGPVIWSDPNQVALFFRSIHIAGLNIIVAVDLSIALIGYLTSARLLNTQITSAEPTLKGWLVALICYPPINYGVLSIYLSIPENDSWKRLSVDSPVLTIVISLAILTLMGIYAWATVAFGMRFSNVTDRGVICTGPYSSVRHPAYITKNTAWWFECLPMFAAAPVQAFIFSLHLLGINTIYFFRALTEEKHMMREAHYREYCRKVPWRFIPGVY